MPKLIWRLIERYAVHSNYWSISNFWDFESRLIYTWAASRQLYPCFVWADEVVTWVLWRNSASCPWARARTLPKDSSCELLCSWRKLSRSRGWLLAVSRSRDFNVALYLAWIDLPGFQLNCHKYLLNWKYKRKLCKHYFHLVSKLVSSRFCLQLNLNWFDRLPHILRSSQVWRSRQPCHYLIG